MHYILYAIFTITIEGRRVSSGEEEDIKPIAAVKIDERPIVEAMVIFTRTIVRCSELDFNVQACDKVRREVQVFDVHVGLQVTVKAIERAIRACDTVGRNTVVAIAARVSPLVANVDRTGFEIEDYG
jgi:hypothetical protein